MRHILRANVCKKGYTLFSVQGNTYQECPLDIKSNGISQNYLNAQRRIDDMLRTQISRWHFAIANLNPPEQPVVAYGWSLPIEDDKGRSGVSFVHAVECNLSEISRVVMCIIQMLLPSVIEKMTKHLAELAQKPVSPQNFIAFLTQKFTSLYEQTANSAAKDSNPIQEIQHNCGGATAMAWLVMAVSHTNISSPWEIYDHYSNSTGLLSTLSSYSESSESYLLSSYISQLFHHSARYPSSGLLSKHEAIHESLVPQVCSKDGVIYSQPPFENFSASYSKNQALLSQKISRMTNMLVGIILLLIVLGIYSWNVRLEQAEKWQELQNQQATIQKTQLEQWQELKNQQTDVTKKHTQQWQTFKNWLMAIQKMHQEHLGKFHTQTNTSTGQVSQPATQSATSPNMDIPSQDTSKSNNSNATISNNPVPPLQ